MQISEDRYAHSGLIGTRIPEETERPLQCGYHDPNSPSSLRLRHFMGLTGNQDHE